MPRSRPRPRALPPQTLRPDWFRVLKEIAPGQGGMNSGILVVKHRTTGDICVEKKFSGDMIRGHLAQREISLHRKLDHENIVKFFECDFSQDGIRASMWLEWCHGGTLGDLVTRHRDAQQRVVVPIDEQFVWKVLMDVARALKYCHFGPRDSNRHWTPVIHKDLKPDNIFFSWRTHDPWYPRIKLGDFGTNIEAQHSYLTNYLLGCFVQPGRSQQYLHGAGTPGFLPSIPFTSTRRTLSSIFARDHWEMLATEQIPASKLGATINGNQVHSEGSIH
ncbi:kinase-like protein [Pleomassaria siparia CBS 279.74]|uniref:non-specific serine/threonine protein kinase n=1 Tax=Pleomassaria siparia CBS 279.74 TaxID=1314801 RepID=A0A6G1KDC5_9PLEO|nr:kinase-like protein [Pleomassaria siparia CBS 279.74]